MQKDHIRNFSIIAHIDHGKSTLADRLIEMTGTLSKREMEEQILDSMDLEKERGITIKDQAVQSIYRAKNGEDYMLNFIDTPGHVDFNYEVSRALAACEGALLVIDASQGIEAQTLAKGVDEILEAIVQRIPAPECDDDKPLKALVFDSKFDSYKGVLLYLRVYDGTIRKGMKIEMMATGATYEVTEVGVFKPAPVNVDVLRAGEVGFLAAAIKTVGEARVGDTVTDANHPAGEPLPGYRKATPMVFCGLYPVENTDYDNLRDALEKLHLNDASLLFEPETSTALGFGFRCGFLGLLHMDVIKERLEREYKLDLITTAPNVVYQINKTNGDIELVDNPSAFPDPTVIAEVAEPYVTATIIVPKDYVGAVMELSQEKRGEYQNMTYLDEDRVMIHYSLPLSEIIYDYFDRLKSCSRGYASLDYELAGYKPSDLVKVDILLNGDQVDELCVIGHCAPGECPGTGASAGGTAAEPDSPSAVRHSRTGGYRQ